MQGRNTEKATRRKHWKYQWKRREKEERVESGEDGKWLFLILLVMRKFGAASSASDNVQKRQGKLEETQWKTEMVRDSWVGEVKGMFQKCEKTKNRSEMQQKPSKTLRCALLNGSASSTEKHMKRYKGTFDIFLVDGGAFQLKPRRD